MSLAASVRSFQTCHLVLELRLEAAVGDGERAGAQKGRGPWVPLLASP